MITDRDCWNIDSLFLKIKFLKKSFSSSFFQGTHMVNVEQLFTTQLRRPFLASVKVGAFCIDVISCWVQVWQILMAFYKMQYEAYNTPMMFPYLPHDLMPSHKAKATPRPRCHTTVIVSLLKILKVVQTSVPLPRTPSQQTLT